HDRKRAIPLRPGLAGGEDVLTRRVVEHHDEPRAYVVEPLGERAPVCLGQFKEKHGKRLLVVGEGDVHVYVFQRLTLLGCRTKYLWTASDEFRVGEGSKQRAWIGLRSPTKDVQKPIVFVEPRV